MCTSNNFVLLFDFMSGGAGMKRCSVLLALKAQFWYAATIKVVDLVNEENAIRLQTVDQKRYNKVDREILT